MPTPRSDRRRRLIAPLMAALAATASLTACGSGDTGVSAADARTQAADLVRVLKLKDGAALGGDVTFALGAALTLSGPSAGNGQSMRNAIELAVKQIKAAGGPTIKPSVKDIKGPDPVAAKQAASELASEGVPAKIGSMGDGLGAMLADTDKSRILTLDGVGGAQVFTRGTKYFYGTREVAPSDAVFPYDPDVTVRERLAGADRFGTAVAVSKSGFPNGAPVVYLASGTNFPDALAAGPIAAHDGGPLLLTRPDVLPGAIAAEIARLDPVRVVIVGGTGAVTAGVQKSIAKLVPTATVSRVAGKDRYETARALIRTAFPSTIPSLYIATGKVFADALSAGAAAATTGGAVLLVDGTTAVLPTATTALLDTLQPAGVTVVGGVGAVSAGIFRGQSVLDLDYAEDSEAETDANFVMTGGGGFVEIQSTAEGAPFTDDQFAALKTLAREGIAHLVELQKLAIL